MKKMIIPALIFMFSLAAFAGKDSKEVKVNAADSEVTWIGKKVTQDAHNGVISIKEGVLKFEGDELKSVNVVVDMTTITNEDVSSDNMRARLEGHLKSDDFFGVETFPVSTFKATTIKKTGEGAYELTGDLTIKDKTHPITFPATVTKNGDKIEAKADLVFDRSKYDVRFGSKSFFNDLGDNMIYDDIELSVTLIGQ